MTRNIEMEKLAWSAFCTMHRKARDGNFGRDASVAREWMGDKGFVNFFEWFKRTAPDYTAAISKDFLGGSSVFSSETSVVVPARFFNWFYRAAMQGGVKQIGQDEHMFVMNYRSAQGWKTPQYFTSKEEADLVWKELMLQQLKYFESKLNASNPQIVKNIPAMLDAILDGTSKVVYQSRREMNGR